MFEIINKFITSLALIFASLTGSYIGIAEEGLSFDFKTGESTPIHYFLNVQNIGMQKARFDVSSDKEWLFVYREGARAQTIFAKAELPQSAAVNFVLELRPEFVQDGRNEAEISVNAVNLNDYSIMDSKTISVVLNKNVPEEAETPSPVSSPEATESPVAPTPAETASPTVSPNPVPVSPSVSLSPRPTITKTPLSPEPVEEVTLPGKETLNGVKRVLDLIINFLGSLFGR